MDNQELHHLVEKMQESIEKAIKENVNGKIDRLTNKIDGYILTDNDWKATAQPAIDAFKQGSTILNFAVGFVKVVAWLGGGVIAIGSAYLAFIKYIHGNI